MRHSNVMNGPTSFFRGDLAFDGSNLPKYEKVEDTFSSLFHVRQMVESQDKGFCGKPSPGLVNPYSLVSLNKAPYFFWGGAGRLTSQGI